MANKKILSQGANKFPPTIYKYRSWKDANHREVLTEQIVFMAPPSSFEDKMDCKLQKRYDLLTDKEIYTKYLLDSKEKNTSWTRQQHREFARKSFKKSQMKNKEYIKQLQKEHFDEFDRRFGVLSLTANPKLYSMWDKYSDNHKGFCIGFDSEKMFTKLGGGGDVVYYEKLPDIMPFDSFDDEHFKQVFSKEIKWNFEEEYRTHKFYPNPVTVDDRKVKLPKDCFKEIIFGAKLPENERQEIISICKAQNLDIEFYEEIIDTNNEISIHKLS